MPLLSAASEHACTRRADPGADGELGVPRCTTRARYYPGYTRLPTPPWVHTTLRCTTVSDNPVVQASVVQEVQASVVQEVQASVVSGFPRWSQASRGGPKGVPEVSFLGYSEPSY